MRPGAHLYDIGRAIEDHATASGLGVVREFIGHGIGEQFHGGLQILHYFDPRADTVIEPGMTFTIEPMITLGSPDLWVWDDGWTAVTRDGSRSAQFEHTHGGHRRPAPSMLTVTADGALRRRPGRRPDRPMPATGAAGLRRQASAADETDVDDVPDAGLPDAAHGSADSDDTALGRATRSRTAAGSSAWPAARPSSEPASPAGS